MCWDYDQVAGRTTEGFNLINALCRNQDASTPVVFGVMKKSLQFDDMKTRQVKRASEVTNNELMRSMLAVCLSNQLQFRCVLLGSGYASPAISLASSRKVSMSSRP